MAILRELWMREVLFFQIPFPKTRNGAFLLRCTDGEMLCGAGGHGGESPCGS